MRLKSILIGVGLSLFLLPSIATAQMPMESEPEFQRMEQPLELKIAVALGGVGLIGLELWWFIFSKKRTTR